MNHTLGSLALVTAVLIVTGFAIGALAGWVHPVMAAVVGLGGQVVGTIAFFATYYIGTRNLDVPPDEPAPEPPREWTEPTYK